MIILHSGESDDTLVLWGETSTDARLRPTSRRRRRSGDTSASLHPFAASAGELAGALKETGLSLKPAAKRACHVTAWLPTKGSSPVPSSSLIAEPSKSRAKTKLAAWAVPAYRLSAEEAVELLCASAGRRTLAVTVFDPQVDGPVKGNLPPSARLVEGVEEAAEGVQALCLVTEWEEIVRADWQVVTRGMVPPRFVFDGRDALEPREMCRLGFEYAGIGRNSFNLNQWAGANRGWI